MLSASPALEVLLFSRLAAWIPDDSDAGEELIVDGVAVLNRLKRFGLEDGFRTHSARLLSCITLPRGLCISLNDLEEDDGPHAVFSSVIPQDANRYPAFDDITSVGFHFAVEDWYGDDMLSTVANGVGPSGAFHVQMRSDASFALAPILSSFEYLARFRLTELWIIGPNAAGSAKLGRHLIASCWNAHR